MRKRGDIEKDSKKAEYLILEVLLDIRELFKKDGVKRKRGRPKKIKGGI